jgi:hypothetical protein
VSRRYEILDILTQDASGVAFRAEDRETGREVVLRRFFPFGPGGDGLDDEERAAYEIAVRRLITVSHPALRNVLDGGTDPNDGMPFVVTEWIEGEPLSRRLAERPLSPPSVKALLDLALETCQVLSGIFQEECVWIETSTASIVLGPSGQERQVTFRISPLRWLGEDDSRRGLRSILHLAEEATGWHRRMLSDQAGEGLGGWIKALRKDPDRWSLEQARFALHHGPEALEGGPATGLSPVAPLSPAHATIPARTTAPLPPQRNRTLWWPWIVTASVIVVLIGFVYWQAYRPREIPSPVPVTSSTAPGAESASDRGLTDAERVSRRAAELAKEISGIAEIPEPGTAGVVSPEVNQRLIEVGRQLRENPGKTTKITARLFAVRASGSGKTIYLEFGSTEDPDAICARYRTDQGIFTEVELRGHIGKVVRVRGKVVNDSGGRIAIDLTGKDGLKVEKG